MNAKRIGIATLIALVLIALCALLYAPSASGDLIPAQAVCRLCGDQNFGKKHAPCLFDLEAGRIIELACYEPSTAFPGELAAEQPDCNKFRLAAAGGVGLSIERTADRQSCTASVSLSEEGKTQPAGDFCQRCRRLLAPFLGQGFVILDLYDLDAIRAYAPDPGAVYTIRDYTVRVSKQAQSYTIEVSASLF